MFDDRYMASAGTSSKAHLNGNPHFSDPARERNSQFDRNLMLIAMLEIRMSLDKDSLADVEYSTLDLYDTICGSGVGGHRVPVHSSDYETYDFDRGYEIDKFAPVVMYGSLETIRSAHMQSLQTCDSSFAPEDVAHYVFCNLADHRSRNVPKHYLKLDAQQREYYSPFVMHRDRLCNANVEISIEDALARPPEFTDGLKDTPVRDKRFIDHYVAPAWSRGEENIHARLKQLSLKSWVYITSSANASVRPGMHRLLELPVFGSQGCSKLPGVDCSGPEQAANILKPGPVEVVNYEKTATFTRGRLLMRTLRCSQLVILFTGQACLAAPYSGHPTCYEGSLPLVSRPVYYSSRMWLRNLIAPPPSPPPFSPSPPPPSPSPPCPSPPPSPPYVQPQSELMATIRKAEEAACTSVYYLTTATRCDRLAVALTRSVLYDAISPPSSPPAEPTVESPPPPTPPPSPEIPTGMANSPVAAVRMSTYRVPTSQSGGTAELYADGYYMIPSDRSAMIGSLPTASQTALASCTPWQSAAPLPCVSGVVQSNCVSGTRHCDSEASNSLSPELELKLSGTPGSRRNRLWGLEIMLPSNQELASLFFESVESTGGAGYTVKVYKPDGSPVTCASQSEQTDSAGLRSDRKVQHICASGGASDADLYSLADAERILITLTGVYRQIWLKSVTVLEISLADDEPLGKTRNLPPRPPTRNLPPRPPRPPPLPILPPTPPASPSHACTFYTQKFYGSMTVLMLEPCGYDKTTCCASAHEHEAQGYEIDDAGCCKLFTGGVGLPVNNIHRLGYMSTRAGTGLV